jgi:uncharacterized protein with HEPN domain
MRDAAREAIGFATGRTRENLETDRQLLLVDRDIVWNTVSVDLPFLASVVEEILRASDP